jgi:tetratricopeptide (TPR) repeat protein
VSDSNTSLAEHPAGTTRFRTPRRRVRPSRKRWQHGLVDTTPTSVLAEEAGRLAENGKLRQAIRLLAVAATTTEEGPLRRSILQQLAVTAAEGGQHRISGEAIFELQTDEQAEADADTWVTFANVALARGNYGHADQAARTALSIDADHPDAWTALAGSYCGLGWFEAADECLDHLDRSLLSERDQRRLGKAVNRWALSDTPWMVISAIAALLLGVLALAVAVSIPFVAREWRLRNLRSTADATTATFFEPAATAAWRLEHRLRLAHGSAVVASVGAFLAASLLL